MRQRCEYCGSWIDDTDEVCPHCGAPNEHLMASAEGVPKTIDELREFALSHNLPLEDMRFFIGEDFKEPRAFGIFQDGDDFVVYKNKANGERAVRYRGHDEAYAVNELYQKMRSEVANQKAHLADQKSRKADQRSKFEKFRSIATTVVVLAFAATFIVQIFSPSTSYNGYYRYDDTAYYLLVDDWYYYDTVSSSWEPTSSPPTELTDNMDDYSEGSDWDPSSGTSDFSQTQYYQDWESSWDDDDMSWDSSDSWDSGVTDWDSDW